MPQLGLGSAASPFPSPSPPPLGSAAVQHVAPELAGPLPVAAPNHVSPYKRENPSRPDCPAAGTPSSAHQAGGGAGGQPAPPGSPATQFAKAARFRHGAIKAGLPITSIRKSRRRNRRSSFEIAFGRRIPPASSSRFHQCTQKGSIIGGFARGDSCAHDSTAARRGWRAGSLKTRTGLWCFIEQGTCHISPGNSRFPLSGGRHALVFLLGVDEVVE